MKKTIIILIIIQILSIASCCTDKFKIVSSGELIAKSLEGENIYEVEDVFILENRCDIEVAYNHIKNPLINEAYGTSCDIILTNEILMNSLSLFCDKAFENNGQNIEAGNNLIGLEGINVVLDEIGTIQITFENQFILNSNFLQKEYQFSINCETDDGTMIENSIRLKMKI